MENANVNYYGIKKSAKRILSINSDYELLENFCKSELYKKFKDDINNGTWNSYDKFTVKDENTIIVEYSYGAIGTDFEYNDIFTINLLEFNDTDDEYHYEK